MRDAPLDCAFYWIGADPRETARRWEEARRAAARVRDAYDREVEAKYAAERRRERERERERELRVVR